MNVWRNMDRGDRQMFASIAATLFVWWYFAGRKKYGMKGMKNVG